jgi:hypothetical protein
MDLVVLLRQPGSRLVRAERWELGQENAWFTYRVMLANGDFHPVSERIAVVADQKGLVTVVKQADAG